MVKQWKQWQTSFVGVPNYCRWWLQPSAKKVRCLLLGWKAMTNLDSILKNRDITLSTKIHLVKAMAFSVVMYGCESWTTKKAECQRTDAVALWCWKRLLRVPWTVKSNQSILKEIGSEYSLEGLMLKLKLQQFVHLMWRTDSSEKTLMLGKIKCRSRGDKRGWDGWIASPTKWIWIWLSHGNWCCTGKSGILLSMRSQGIGHNWATELNWKTSSQILLNQYVYFEYIYILS